MHHVAGMSAIGLLLTGSVAGLGADEPARWLRPLGDNIHHWRMKLDDDRYPRYEAAQVREIADNILLYQRANGGWPPNWDPTRIIPDGERATVAANRAAEDTSLDNRTSYTHLTYLAHAYGHTADTRYKDGALQGVEFLLAAESPRGGWPHSFPSRRGYHPRTTIMDDVTVGVLNTVRDIAAGQPPFDFVTDELKLRCKAALARGEAFLLAAQVRDSQGRPTVWAGQYDEQTLQPCQGRTFEPPALVSAESVAVVRHLMSLERADVRVQDAVEAAVGWFRRSAIAGLRIERIPIDRVKFPNHAATHDVVEVADSEAAPIWARFYDIATNQPLMANRDGSIVHRLADVEIERRTGYSWYGHNAASLLEKDYPAWKAKR